MLSLVNHYQRWEVRKNGKRNYRLLFVSDDYHEAALMLVAFSDHDLYAAVVKTINAHPILRNRAIAAGILISRGHYHHTDAENESQYREDNWTPPYLVKLEIHDGDTYPTCSCTDFTQQCAPYVGGRHFCKHILAHYFVNRLVELDEELF